MAAPQLSMIAKMLGVDPAEMTRALGAIGAAGDLLHAIDTNQRTIIGLLDSLNQRLTLHEAKLDLVTQVVTMVPKLTNGKAGEHYARTDERPGSTGST